MYQLYSSISVLYLELVVLSDVYSIISINTICWHAKNASFPNKAFKQANLSIGLTKVNTWSKASQSLVKIRWKTLSHKNKPPTTNLHKFKKFLISMKPFELREVQVWEYACTLCRRKFWPNSEVCKTRLGVTISKEMSHQISEAPDAFKEKE